MEGGAFMPEQPNNFSEFNSAGRINQHGLTVVNGDHFQIRDMFFVHSVELSLPG
jgi:hypothetical protein